MNATVSEGVDIFGYLDYRAYCRDFYQWKKKTEDAFSFRAFAKKADVASSYLKHVIDGTRNLSSEMSIKFGHGMGLSAKEIDYFENLVRFNQAVSLEEKTLQFDRLRRKRARALKPIGLTEAISLLSHWYVLAIKELVVNFNTDDPKVIQRVLRKRLSEALIQKTIEDLQKMEWLFQKDGRWMSQASQIQFPDEVKSYLIRSYHRQMLDLAAGALDDELDEREYGAMMFTLPKAQLPALKERIKELEKDIISFVQDVGSRANDDDELKVYHLGIQCFSLQKSGSLVKESSDAN